MCNKTSPPPHDVQTKTKRSKKQRRRQKRSSTVSLRPSRKIRTRTRKPKFLSLLDIESSQENVETMGGDGQRQLDLFPLHPENLVEDRENQYDHVSLLLNGTDNANATLNGLLDVATTSEDAGSLTFGYSQSEKQGDASCLVRTAMKAKERDASEEKWVSYSEVVETKESVEEESICGGGGDDDDEDDRAWCSRGKMKKLLALKLDYQEIMDAWSDKGPLYIEGEGPATVPDLHDGAQVLMDAWGGGGNVWRVPEMVGSNTTDCFKMKEGFQGKEVWRRGLREASLLRYKEKRQNRLFAKRVRYEVRKLNAEKRPRLKGRFVKRD
ncbi:hypothetical protein SLA2020_173740 [Shorea laevis]